ncbi:MAG: glycosyltransferase family 39 protein [Vicinamibacteria bacterium]
MRARETAAVAALLLALAVQLGLAVRGDGLTSDELLYVPAGFLHVARFDLSLDTTHPPLAPALAGLALLGAGVAVPERAPGEETLAYCFRFLHEANAGRALWERARVPAVLLTLALAALLWRWARATHGTAAGLVALALAAFDPSLLAHGHLATTDLPATLAMAVAAWTYWRWSQQPGLARALAMGAAVGAALAVRVTGGLVLPGFAALELWTWWRTAPPQRGARVRAALAAAAIGLVAIPLVVCAAYGFHPGGLARYADNVRFQLDHDRRGHLTYLLGEVSRRGWPSYFAIALAVKSTPGFLLGLALAAAAAIRRVGDPAGVRAHWWMPALAVLGALSAGGIQIGERYLLPVHAFGALLIASAAPSLLQRRGGRALLALVLAGHAVPAVLAAPRGYLPYFNRLAGGTDGGHRVLLDSNLDWGQDLPRLAAWMRSEGVSEIALGYVGADQPDRLGIARRDLPGRNLYAASAPDAPLAGTVVVSPALVYGLAPRHAAYYAPLRDRAPDARAGVFFVYRMGEDARR